MPHGKAFQHWVDSPPIHPAYLNQLPDEKVSYAKPPTAVDKLAEVLNDGAA